MHHLSIDIESFSSTSLLKAGVYKYVESSDFEILLLAYSLNGSAVEIIDLAQGERVPEWLVSALTDPDYIKHAYNANFEITCLTKFFGYLPADQWRCTMLHGLYCGLAGNLAALGKAMKLPEDKQKLSAGRRLIQYFCVPCKPTKVNGGRVRNLPKHDMGKWELFKEYCKGDVIAETEILKRLEYFPVPASVQQQWVTDHIINTRGVEVDMNLVYGALEIGEVTKAELMTEARELSGLNNPNSVSQLTAWLEEELDEEVTDLRKDTVSRMLERELDSETARRMLEIRKELGKTSTKKYNAIEAAVCSDSRVRGLLQFYGANRSGRYAGRLVQVQNLPRTYISPLPLARDIIKQKQKDKLSLLYGSVPDTLSQMIRTGFIPSKGKVFVDVDFSSIEARVISWLAGEEWRLEVFRTHGKIYEASASQMFGVPLDLIKKGNPEYALRQRGKVAELALGYMGGTGALIAMGALDMGLKEEELPEIVSLWRNSNKRIRELWYAVDSTAISVVQTGQSIALKHLVFSREYDKVSGLDFLTILLPSGRKLYYAEPRLTSNRWGNLSLSYMGLDQTTKTWKSIETYGGKIVENICQAIARDCLAEAIENLEAAGYPIVMHCHDEVVIECPKDMADLTRIIKIMSSAAHWSEGLPLSADGWIGDFYKKE